MYPLNQFVEVYKILIIRILKKKKAPRKISKKAWKVRQFQRIIHIWLNKMMKEKCCLF